MIQSISLHLVQHDPDLQMRTAGIDAAVVADYAEAMLSGIEFPPVVLFFDGATYWPGDGFHRLEAARRSECDTILADVREGSKREATLFAVGANASHGLRRTAADKRRAVQAMLKDPEWTKWSDREIGKRCAVDHKTVAKVRGELTGEFPSERSFTTRHGTVATMKVRETPKAHAGATMVERMLAKAETVALVTECRRRGLEVSGHAD
jgi:3',5'-cyclic AMP phosphodiesterase CpdA